MAIRVAPYHSTDQTDPDVHHVFSDCPNGKQIPAANKKQGTNKLADVWHMREYGWLVQFVKHKLQ